VVAVYDELASQGWVEIIPNKGTYILMPERTTAPIKAASQNIDHAYKYAKHTGFPFQTSFNLSSTRQITKAKFSLNDGRPDLRLHPVHQFSKWYSAVMKRKSLINKWQDSTTTCFGV